MFNLQTNSILSSLYVCMAKKHIIVLFVETPRKFITAYNCNSILRFIMIYDDNNNIKRSRKIFTTHFRAMYLSAIPFQKLRC